MKRILQFRGDEFFLSNFYFVEVEYKGITYPSLEHAYQAAKTKSKLHQARIRFLKTPGQAKRYGKLMKELGVVREDWMDINLGVMEELLRIKFGKSHVTKLWVRLKNTGDAKLIEGNSWFDKFWGMHKDPDGMYRGKNHLGKLLMKLRSEL